MAGTATNTVRCVFVAETVIGTTPATPGFTTAHDAIVITATPNIYEQPSLTAGGAIVGLGIKSVPVTGSLGGAFVYGALDDWLASLMQGAWATNTLKDGKTNSAFTVENTMAAGAGGTNTMLRYRGVGATGGKLTLASESEAKLTMDLIGTGFTSATTTAITGATYSDPTNAVPLTSGIDVGAITFGSSGIVSIQDMEIDFVFDGRTPQNLASGLDTAGTTLGAFRPRITATALVDTTFAAAYNSAMSVHPTFAVAAAIGSVSGSKYTFTFPKCSFVAAGIDYGSAELLQKVEVVAQYDSTSSSVLTVARAVT